MSQSFLKAEGMNHYLPGPTPQGGRDLPGKQCGRRARQEQFDLLRIEQPPDEPLPAGNGLDLIEAPDDALVAPQRREPPIILLDQRVKVLGRQSGQPLVLEVDVRHLFAGDAALEPLPLDLVQEHRLAGAAHAHHGRRLAAKLHCAEHSPGSAIGQRCAQGVGELFVESFSKKLRCGRVHRF
jgi:hypothetical protein